MAPAAWKGILRFGLISIPVKLYRAARAETVSFRQLDKATRTRVRHRLSVENDGTSMLAAAPNTAGPEISPVDTKSKNHAPAPSFNAPANAVPPALSRQDVAKGYEYAKDRYVVLNQKELSQLVPSTACEMNVGEFVQLAEIDPAYFDNTFYVVPNRHGAKAYAVLFEALSHSERVGVTQMTIHSREYVAILRACARGIVAQTLFYDAEIRREHEYSTDGSGVGATELELALRLIDELRVPFEPLKYFDRYRDGLLALVRTRIAEQNTTGECPAAGASALINLLERSLKPKPPKPSPIATKISEEAATNSKRTRSTAMSTMGRSQRRIKRAVVASGT